MAVRRVRRVIRKFDPWTVLKVSFVFNAIAALIFVLGTWVLWSVLLQRGVPDRIVELADRLTIDITIDGQLYGRIVVLLAVIWSILMTGVMTLAAVLYNLISDLVGGIELTVLEETFNTNPAAAPQRRVRPAVHRRPAPAPGAPVPNAQRAAASQQAQPAVKPAPAPATANPVRRTG
jgi:hypothetical protein